VLSTADNLASDLLIDRSTYAGQIDPIFLIIHQFNEFVPPDEGFDANTDDDIEPANLWGTDLETVKHQIDEYRRRVGAAH